ncbi:MAG TPA: YozE family protein [Roseateles sp.]
MTTPLSEAQLERLRRDAKRIARDKSIPLSEAQQQLAVERGFKNWSLMASATNTVVAATAPPPRTATPVAPVERPFWLSRLYLHGDASEDEPGGYFCVRCDAMRPIEHFQPGGDHGDQTVNFERFLYSHGRWLERREERPDRERLDDAPNLFHADAYAARAKYEASRSEFHKWLDTQRNRDTPVGDLASDILRDKKFPVGASTKEELDGYLGGHRSHVQEALNQAWKSFQARQRRQQARQAAPKAAVTPRRPALEPRDQGHV